MAQEGDGHDAIAPFRPLGASGGDGGSRPIDGAGQAIGQEPFGWDGTGKIKHLGSLASRASPDHHHRPQSIPKSNPPGQEHYSLTARCLRASSPGRA